MFLYYFNTYFKISVSLLSSAISMNSNLEVLNLANVVGLTATAVDAITRRCSKYVVMFEIILMSQLQFSKNNLRGNYNLHNCQVETAATKSNKRLASEVDPLKVTLSWFKGTQMVDKKRCQLVVNMIFVSSSVDKSHYI